MLLGVRALSNPPVLNTLFKFIRLKPSCHPFRLLHLNSYSEVGVSSQVYSYNRAIQVHLESRSLTNALQLFDEMLVRDVISWNLMISGYKRHGMPKQALELYSEMISQGVMETPSTFSTVLSICSSSRSYLEGLQVHGRLIMLGFCRNLHVGSSIVDLYMQMGLVDVGMRVFDEMPERNCAAWNLVLRGHCQMNLWEDILKLFQRMKLDGVQQNDLSLCYLLKACCNGGFGNEGKQFHGHIVKLGLIESNLFIANALVDFYSVLGSLLDAQKSIESIPEEEIISWNSIIHAYADNGVLSVSVEYFSKMLSWGKKPVIRSFVVVLNLCSATENLSLGRQIHSFVVKEGFEGGSVHVQSALIDMYGKCYDIESSVFLFDTSIEVTIECCNALMTSLLHCHVFQNVAKMFSLMVAEGIGFDEVSLSSTLKALSLSYYSNLTNLYKLHCCAVKSGFGSDNAVSCALMDAYSKSGHVLLSHKVFENLSSPNVVCFTSIINGYARNGMGTVCLELLELMVKMGLKPDCVTFLCILIGCSHSGLLKEGKFVFDSMKSIHGIDPDRRHFSCLIDLFGRTGLLIEAEDLLRQPLIRDDTLMWSSLLRSCRIHQSEEVGRRAASRLIELARGDPASCLQASSFYYEIGDLKSSTYCRELAAAGRVSREIGYSFVELDSFQPAL